MDASHILSDGVVVLRQARGTYSLSLSSRFGNETVSLAAVRFSKDRSPRSCHTPGSGDDLHLLLFGSFAGLDSSVAYGDDHCHTRGEGAAMEQSTLSSMAGRRVDRFLK
jgi:hypothetical protein